MGREIRNETVASEFLSKLKKKNYFFKTQTGAENEKKKPIEIRSTRMLNKCFGW